VELPVILLLLAAGLGGGIMSSIVGGASILTFPALLAAGLPPAAAVAATTAALTPGLFLAVHVERSRLPPGGRMLAAMMAVALAGGLVGAALLLITPERVLAGLIPLLLAFATLTFAQARRIGGWLAERAGRQGQGQGYGRHTLVALIPCAVYGGYFGAGLGVILLGLMSIGSGGDYRSANAMKNLLSALNSITATLVFALQGLVPWPATLMMMGGVLGGSLLGVRLAQVMPGEAARTLVVAIGALLTLIFAWRYWL
jgi:uncharacterized membrane protein YfcA